MDILKIIDNFITELLNNIDLFAPLLASALIIVESIIPILPLSVFITVNFVIFGSFFGFILSWLLTCIGCYLSFTIFRKNVKFWFDNKFVKNEEKRIAKWMKVVNRLKLEQLVLLMAIPFTPAFLVNIVAGLSSINKSKFLTAVFISKIFLVLFWGLVGTTFLDSLKNPIDLVKIVVITSIAYLISKIVNRKFHLE